MSKHDVLTEEEFKTYVPNRSIMTHFFEFVESSTLSEKEIKVLDWGCGRGRDVLWLRRRGYQAFGVDVDPEPIKKGLPLFLSSGHSEECLKLLDENGRTTFSDSSFHFVFSGNVLEHVSDIQGVAAEIGRLTRQAGSGFHVFPAQRQVVEGHLYMPLVHWVPRGILRKMLIFIYVLFGREPNWIEVKNSTPREKTDYYYAYTVNNTFYRPYSKVRSVFEQAGFDVAFTTIEHPAVKANKILAPFTKGKRFRGWLNHLLLTFKLVEMQVSKR